MNRTLTTTQYILVGSMLFGMFFGAGNLIFPVHLGQEAGSNYNIANLGFMVTAIGLPFLGIIAIGISKSTGLFDLASKVNRPYAHLVTVLLYLTIGPAFALPRTAAVSYEIGFAGSLDPEHQTLALFGFSFLFFAIALLFALKPAKIVTWIGKFLNPLFLVLIGLLMVTAIFSPMGNPADFAPQGDYNATPFVKGITEGYNTMDALASLAFGIIVIQALKDMGLKSEKDIAIGTVKAGIVVLVLMGIIYTFLSYAGASSLGAYELSKNGGIALAQISQFYFGSVGHILLAATVTVACLKTALGLITACSATFSELYPSTLSYKKYVFVITIVSFIIANVGLTEIISLAIPILFLLYPLAITLILLAYIGWIFGYRPCVYRLTTLFTLIAAFGDMLQYLPYGLTDTPLVQSIISFYASTLPMYDLGLGWVVPSLIGLVLGFIVFSIRK